MLSSRIKRSIVHYFHRFASSHSRVLTKLVYLQNLLQPAGSRGWGSVNSKSVRSIFDLYDQSQVVPAANTPSCFAERGYRGSWVPEAHVQIGMSNIPDSLRENNNWISQSGHTTQCRQCKQTTTQKLSEPDLETIKRVKFRGKGTQKRE